MNFLGLMISILLSFSAIAEDKKQAAYLIANHLDKAKLESHLKMAGFEVMGSAQVNESPKHTVIFYTSPNLLKIAASEKRGFAGALRILIDADKNQLMVANPQYFLRAFLQKDFDAKLAGSITAALTKALGELKSNEDLLDEDDLAGYRFMFGMPYYEDFEEVGEGDQATLIKRLEARAGKNIVFKKQIGEKYLYAVTLPKEIESFVQKLEVKDKSTLLPYMVVVDKNKARILHAKYYLAVSLPKLSMGQFMTISGIPGDIEDAFEAFFAAQDKK